MATTRCGSACRADWRRALCLGGKGATWDRCRRSGCRAERSARALRTPERTRVESFAVIKPSLHDIFVRIAGPAAAEEVGHA